MPTQRHDARDAALVRPSGHCLGRHMEDLRSFAREEVLRVFRFLAQDQTPQPPQRPQRPSDATPPAGTISAMVGSGSTMQLPVVRH